MAKKSENFIDEPTSNLEKNIKDLQKQLEDCNSSKNEWRECALYYAEKFQLAYKGYLMTQGLSEEESQKRSLDVLDKIVSIED